MVPPLFPLVPKSSTIPALPPNYTQVLKQRAAALGQLLASTKQQKK